MNTRHTFLGHRASGGMGTVAGFLPPGAPFGWYDGSDIDGANNTTLTPGQTITSWFDKGSGGNTMAIATSSNGPEYRSPLQLGKYNNLDGVFFDRTNTEAMEALYAAVPQPCTYGLIYANNTIVAPNQHMFDAATGSLATENQFLTTVAPFRWGIQAGIARLSGNILDTFAHSGQIVFDGVLSEMDQDAVGIIPVGSAGPNPQKGLQLGAQPGGASYFDGELAELLMYDVNQPFPGIFQYFCNKYGGFPQ